MGLRERYRQLPPNPFRRQRRDVLIGVAGAVISGMDAVAGATRRVTLPGELDRTIALTVADRRVVAHDQDVVALTLVAPKEPCRAGIRAHTSTFTCRADWCGSTRCAGTR